MAKYLDLTGLQKYDSKIKTYIQNQIANLQALTLQYVVSNSVDTTPDTTYFGEDAGTLAPSSDTEHIIYLVPTDAVAPNIYEEWLTIEISGVYSWEKIGTTNIDLSNYQEKNVGVANAGKLLYVDSNGDIKPVNTFKYLTGQDLDTLIGVGLYVINTPTNAPSGIGTLTTVIVEVEVVSSQFRQTLTTGDYICSRSVVTVAGSFTGVSWEIKEIQEKLKVFSNVSASSWVSDNTYADYGYKCELTCNGITANSVCEVVYSLSDAISGNYAPICETATDKVIIYSKVNTTITIPTIKEV